MTADAIMPSAVDRLCAELGFATAVCRGIVTVDLTDCSELGMKAAPGGRR